MWVVWRSTGTLIQYPDVPTRLSPHDQGCHPCRATNSDSTAFKSRPPQAHPGNWVPTRPLLPVCSGYGVLITPATSRAPLRIGAVAWAPADRRLFNYPPGTLTLIRNPTFIGCAFYHSTGRVVEESGTFNDGMRAPRDSEVPNVGTL